MDNFIISKKTQSEKIKKKLGGKGEKLIDLEKTGLNIPPWYGISSDLFLQAVDTDNVKEKIEELLLKIKKNPDETEIEKAGEELQKIITDIKLDNEHINILKKEHFSYFSQNDYFSVRSSAIGEDGEDISFAGIHESFLYITGFDQLIEKIKKVWASAFSSNALKFRINNNISLENISMGVVVQKMIDSEKSGVIFTVNPNTSNTNEIFVSSLYGAGEGLVSQGFDADLYTILKDRNSFESVTGNKTEQLVFDEEKKIGLKKETVANSLALKDSLNSTELEDLKKTAIKIETFFKRPQDIEFSIDKNGKVFILQSRPVTTAKEYGPARGEKIVWDNSNIIESYSGPTSPMTISFIKHAYSIVYFCFSNVMGISQKKIDANKEIFSNMLGFFNGRVYYNILNWYRLVRLFPGFGYNKKFMESMMGLKDVETLEDKSKTGFFHKYFIELPSLLKLIAKTSWNFFRIDRRVKEFNKNFENNYKKWKKTDFAANTPFENMKIYESMEKNLLWKWDIPIINDFYVMVFYGLLKNLCIKWCKDESGSLQNDLICGDGNIDSTKPTRLLLEISELVKSDTKYLNLFINKSPKELNAIINEQKDFKEIKERTDHYLDEYGFRCINELKLEEPSLHETPDFIYQCIQNYLAMDSVDSVNPDYIENREKEIRNKAWHKAAQEIGSSRFSKIKMIVFKRVLNNARKGVRNRENMRFARTKVYGILRTLLNGTGEYLAQEKIIPDYQDIYYLKIDELWDYVKGTAVDSNLKALIQMRKKEYDLFYSEEGTTPDDHFETYGLPYHKNLWKNHKTFPQNDFSGDLKGTGCSPGIVSGKIKIVRSPKDNLKLNNEILVAERTDPGWVPLYPSVSGVLIERGSILSHSAIVAREMGIPTIVGIDRLIEILSDVEEVSMDGTTGIVNIKDKE